MADFNFKMPGDDSTAAPTATAVAPAQAPAAQTPVDMMDYQPAPDAFSASIGMVAPPVNATLGDRFHTALKNLGTLKSDITNLVPNLNEAADAIPGVAQQQAEHPIINNAANDVASILSAPAEIVAHPIKTAEGFIPATLTGFKQAAESLTIPFGGNPEDIKSQWAAHPVLQILNFVGAGEILGGLMKAGVKAAITSSVVDEATAGTTQAAAAGTIDDATAASVKATVTKPFIKTVVNNLTTKGADPAAITEQLQNAFLKNGVSPEHAPSLAQATLETIADRMKGSIPLKVADALSHPVSALTGFASPLTSPIIKSVFSKPAESAVSYLFGDEAIKKNPTAFAQMEESASQQLQERGIADTVQNRVGIMSEWAKTNPDWASLDTAGKADHMSNFAQTTPAIADINKITGQTYVPIKALSPENASTRRLI